MAAKVKLSSRRMTEVVWGVVLQSDEELRSEKEALFKRLARLDDLRETADYNTGSITPAAAWCIYNLVRYFRCKRIIEVGTFIGKSTISMAAAMDDAGVAGEIFTCDGSNDIKLPWDGRPRIHQFPKTFSADMLKQIEGPCDMVFLDGRLKKAELELLDPLITEDTLFALDDFEGMEKGVINLTVLMTMPKLKNHFVVYPPSSEWLTKRGFTTHSLTALLIPVSWFVFARQG